MTAVTEGPAPQERRDGLKAGQFFAEEQRRGFSFMSVAIFPFSEPLAGSRGITQSS
jgi:hypothetical protein